jgi:hypothetical protein
MDPLVRQSELVARRVFLGARRTRAQLSGFRREPMEATLSTVVRVADDGCLQCPVETFHEFVSRGVVGGGPRDLNATHPGQGLEKLGFNLTSLVGGGGLRATEAG